MNELTAHDVSVFVGSAATVLTIISVAIGAGRWAGAILSELENGFSRNADEHRVIFKKLDEGNAKMNKHAERIARLEG